MKLVQSLIVAALVAAPVVSFAQSQPQQAVTRAEVRAELVQLEKAGYNPASDNAQYPRNIEAAQARLNAAHDATAYGGAANGNSASGSRVPMKRAAAEGANDGSNVIGLGSIYAHS
ncbi:DUF4148 domain-containing protein [Paraburkholderia sp. MMS20-SJTN17]|uniref:DUF4148 domain-containing protein n=1 Tax=Paraburkholderia translucens TaxID=2886945 RepID=A0ABS8KDF2_9BURK|nr:DUF4148 domain-containing protein [Paraburkholderia sp. MMS20-SJTN17]MCC8402791.1 DUF4148 domain-containing protein [Paraburkholderia sp. MMS20-SJTN17]